MGQNFVDGLQNGLTVRRSVTAADSDTLATFKTTHGDAYDCRGRGYIGVRGDFDTNARTSKFRVLFFSYDSEESLNDKLLGQTEEYDLNATAQTNEDGKFESDGIVLIPCEGYQKFRIKFTSLSGGTVRVKAPTFA